MLCFTYVTASKKGDHKMGDIRKHISPEQKAKITVEVLSGQKTFAQLSSEHGVHPSQLSKWKQQGQLALIDTFSSRAQSRAKKEEKGSEEMKKIIGELTLENSYLKKN
jgi:putative transposase